MPSFKIIGFPVLEKKIFKIFTIYGHGGHLGHVTWTIYTNFRSPFPRRLHIKFGLNWPSGFRRLKMVDDDDDNDNDDGKWVYYKLTYEPSAQVS